MLDIFLYKVYCFVWCSWGKLVFFLPTVLKCGIHFRHVFVRVGTLAIRTLLLAVIRFMCLVHHCFHEIVANISCLNLMYPLKQALTVHRRKYFVHSIPSCIRGARFGHWFILMMIHWMHRVQISVFGSGTKISIPPSFGAMLPAG